MVSFFFNCFNFFSFFFFFRMALCLHVEVLNLAAVLCTVNAVKMDMLKCNLTV